MVSVSVLLAIVIAGISPGDAIVLDGTKQLFLDDEILASQTNVVRRIHPAQKHPANPLLRPKEPWEGKLALLHGSVIHDGDKYRMWYLSGPGVSYAESKDGIEWVKPQLDLFEIDGHKTNAVVRRETEEGESGTIPYMGGFLGVLPNPGSDDPGRRYLMTFVSIHRNYKGPHEDPFHHGQRRGLGVAGSPDGFRWTLIDNWTSEAICDGPGHYMVDRSGKFVFYGRTKYVSPEVRKEWDEDEWCKKNCWGRSVTRIESPDFLHWNYAERSSGPVVLTVDEHDPVGTEIYSMRVFPYESVYIALLQMFHNQPDECTLDVQLGVSRDGVHFTRVGDRSTFIPNGPVGSWERFNISLANNPPLEVGDELRIYYSGRTYRHSPYKGSDRGESGGAIGMATVKRDRFVSLGASFDGGQLVTKPMKIAGKTLHLNAKSDFGEILVEAVEEDGRVIARSKPVKADSLDMVVEWEEGKLDGHDGPVTLKISLRNALLFALWSI